MCISQPASYTPNVCTACFRVHVGPAGKKMSPSDYYCTSTRDRPLFCMGGAGGGGGGGGGGTVKPVLATSASLLNL